MYYNDFEGEKLSALGMGMMRLPVVSGDDSKIDYEAAEKMVDYAFSKGINYFDTAWGYHHGNSELVAGKILEKYPRESFRLASKFPGYDLSNMTKVKEIFERQLEKCRVEYFDFYLFHNVCEKNIDAYLDPKFGIYEYLLEQKKLGRIKHLGFSCHGDIDVLRRFLDAYGENMEFCQLQMNYIDWEFQNVKNKVALLNEHNIPVWVMEPLRGGKLAKLPDEHEAVLKNLRPDEDVPAWAFRFLQSVPGVTMILSGMSSFEQLLDNINTFSEKKPLNEHEKETLLGIASEMTKKTAVPCTGCHYCTSHCPKGLDIPKFLELYNEHVFTGGGFLAPMTLEAFPKDKLPSACIKCRACEKVCPQQIKIPDVLTDFVKRLG